MSRMYIYSNGWWRAFESSSQVLWVQDHPVARLDTRKDRYPSLALPADFDLMELGSSIRIEIDA